MANVNPPVKGQAFTLSAFLYKNDGTLITNPGTLTDKISKDYGDWGDPSGAGASEEDSTYGQIKIALDATDMNADVVDVYLVDDTSGCIPFTATIYTCSATRGLSGTALPDAAADAAGGLPISDAGGLDLDTYIKRLETAITSTILGRIDAAISTRGTANPGDAMTLTEAYDAAKTAAQTGEAATAAAAVTVAGYAVGQSPAEQVTGFATPDDLPSEPPSASTIASAVWASVSRTLTAFGEVTVSSPVAASGTITIYEGDDYSSDEARQISVSVTDASHLFKLDDAEAVVRLKCAQATWVATDVTETETGYLLTFEPDTEDTAEITRPQSYEIEATLANGHVITLARGSIAVVRDIPAIPEPEE